MNVAPSMEETELDKLRKALSDRNKAIAVFRERLTDLNAVMEQDWEPIREGLMARLELYIEQISQPLMQERCRETLKEILDAYIVPVQTKNAHLKRALREAIGLAGVTPETVSYSKTPALAEFLTKGVRASASQDTQQ